MYVPNFFIITIFIFLLILYLLLKYNLLESFQNSNKTFLSYNKYLTKSYVTSLPNCEKSQKRLKLLKKEHKNNNLPEPKLNRALHAVRDKEYIMRNFPNININSKKYKERPGSYGLTASFINFLKNNKNNNYSMWYEDDAIPTRNYNFTKELNNSLETLPERGNDIYYFGYTNYCKNKCNKSNKKWKNIDKNLIIYGTHAVLFTKDSIDLILDYIDNHRIDLPIDDLMNYLSSLGYINLWVLSGYKAGKDDMICGLFDQTGISCTNRNGIINDIVKKY